MQEMQENVCVHGFDVITYKGLWSLDIEIFSKKVDFSLWLNSPTCLLK